MSRARKDHRCEFCKQRIATGSEYVRQEITPWDHPDNECFYTLKAHPGCYAVWNRVGEQFEWEFPFYACDFIAPAVEFVCGGPR